MHYTMRISEALFWLRPSVGVWLWHWEETLRERERQGLEWGISSDSAISFRLKQRREYVIWGGVFNLKYSELKTWTLWPLIFAVGELLWESDQIGSLKIDFGFPFQSREQKPSVLIPHLEQNFPFPFPFVSRPNKALWYLQAGTKSPPSLSASAQIFTYTIHALLSNVCRWFMVWPQLSFSIPPKSRHNSFCSQPVGFYSCCGCPRHGLENGSCISSLYIQHIPTPALSTNKAASVEAKNYSNITVVRCRWSWGTSQGFGTESTLVAHWAGCGIAGINEKALLWAVYRRVIVWSWQTLMQSFKKKKSMFIQYCWSSSTLKLNLVALLHRFQPVHALIFGARAVEATG